MVEYDQEQKKIQVFIWMGLTGHSATCFSNKERHLYFDRQIHPEKTQYLCLYINQCQTFEKQIMKGENFFLAAQRVPWIYTSSSSPCIIARDWSFNIILKPVKDWKRKLKMGIYLIFLEILLRFHWLFLFTWISLVFTLIK